MTVATAISIADILAAHLDSERPWTGEGAR